MNETGIQDAGPPDLLIDRILHQHPRFDRDAFEIGGGVWAITGYIPVDGEVILAEFDDRESARAVLEQLAAAEDRAGSGSVPTEQPAVQPENSGNRMIGIPMSQLSWAARDGLPGSEMWRISPITQDPARS